MERPDPASFNSFPLNDRIRMVREHGEFISRPGYGQPDHILVYLLDGLFILVKVDLERLKFLSATAYTLYDGPIVDWAKRQWMNELDGFVSFDDPDWEND